MSFLAFGNNDLTPAIQSVLTTQLRLNEIISLTEFNARMIAAPDYPLVIYQNDIHLLVLGSYYDLGDRSVFDFCLFFKDGQCAIESCHNNGPPGFSVPIARLTIDELRHHFPPFCCFDDKCCDDDTVQDNILYPLYEKITDPQAFPFGENEDHSEGNPYNLPIKNHNLFYTDQDED
jgi:hypothetical protein